MALEDEMNNLTGPTELEQAGMVVEIVSGQDEATAGALPEEGKEGTSPPPITPPSDNLVIPVEGVTPEEEPRIQEPAPETPVSIEGAPQEELRAVEQPVEQQAVTAAPGPLVTPSQMEQPIQAANTSLLYPTRSIVASATASTLDVLTDSETGALDPLRLPDALDPRNGPTLYKMFFEHDDPNIKARIDSAIVNAKGFISERDVNEDGQVDENDVVMFSGDNYSLDDVYDRVRYMVYHGGTRLVYPKYDPVTNKELTDANGNTIYDATTTVPVLADLELYRREDTSDITVPVWPGEEVTLLDIPRADSTPEGQEQLDNYLQAIGMSPYERLIINRAESSGYLPAITAGGRAGDFITTVQNIGAGIVNQPLEGVFSAISEFAGMRDVEGIPSYVRKEDGTVEEIYEGKQESGPFIPYAPTFAQEISERLGISESQAEALIGYTGDAVTRGQRVVREGFPVLASFLVGRGLRDKKMQDRFISWVKGRVNAADEKDLLPKIISEGKTLDGLLGEYIRTEVRAPFKLLQGFAERGTVRALQRASGPMARVLSPTKKSLIALRNAEIEQVTNAITANQKRLRDLIDRLGTNRASSSLEVKQIEDRLKKLGKQRDKLLSKGISDLLPDTLKRFATEEGLALGSGVFVGQLWQDVFNDSSTYLDDKGQWAEAAGSIVGVVGLPMLGHGLVSGGKWSFEKATGAMRFLLNNTTADLSRGGLTTGDAGLDSRLDDLYKGLKMADPEFQRYILDQFDYLRGIRDQLMNATDRDGNRLLSPESVELTFSQMTGLMIFDAYSNYIIRNLDSSDLTKVTEELATIETMLIKGLQSNNEMARAVNKITGAAIEDSSIAPVAKVLNSFVESSRRGLDDKLSATHASIRKSADLARQYLKGERVDAYDPETGDIVTVNFEDIFEAERRSIIEQGLRNGDDWDTIGKELKATAVEINRVYREGLAIGNDVLTASDGDASKKLNGAFWKTRSDRYEAVKEAFEELRKTYPNAVADARFLIDSLKGLDPELVRALGDDVLAGAREVGGVNLPRNVQRGITKALDESYGRFEQQLRDMNMPDDGLAVLKDLAGIQKGDNGLKAFTKLDSFLRKAAGQEDGDEIAEGILGPGAKKEDLVALADNMELPITFQEAQLISTGLAKMATKYSGTPQAMTLSIMRERFLEEMGGETYGFRVNGQPMGGKIKADWENTRQFAKDTYYDPFFTPGTWTFRHGHKAKGSAESLPLYKYAPGDAPSKMLPKLFNEIEGFNSRFLDRNMGDASALEELESRLAMVFGRKGPDGNFYIDIDSPEAQDVGRILQAFAAENFLKTHRGQELIKKMREGGEDFDLVREVLKITNEGGEYNPFQMQNILSISGRRFNDDGTISGPMPLLAESDLQRVMDPVRTARLSEEAGALMKGAITAVDDKTKRLMDASSAEHAAEMRKLNSFERLSKLVTGGELGESGQSIFRLLSNNPQGFDDVRETFILQALRDGDAETTQEAVDLFHQAIRQQLGKYISEQFITFQGRSVFKEAMYGIENPERMADLLGISNPYLQEELIEIFGATHYESLKNIALFYAGRQRPDVPVRFLVPRGLTPEAMYSRLNNVNRNVSGVRWTIVEFFMRSLRAHNSDVLTEMFQNPKVAQVFEQMILENREITPSMMRQLEDAMSNAVSSALFLEAMRAELPGAGAEPDVDYRQQLEGMGLISIDEATNNIQRNFAVSP